MKYFNQREVLQKIGHTRVPKLLEEFEKELTEAGIKVPHSPDGSGWRISDEEAERYFGGLAVALKEESSLPARLREAMELMEAAADQPGRLDVMYQERFPCIARNPNCPLDWALDFWFDDREMLNEFRPVNGVAQTDSGNGTKLDIAEGDMKDTPEDTASRGGLMPSENGALKANGHDPEGFAESTNRETSGDVGAGANGVLPVTAETEEQVFARLARLSPPQYDRVRIAEAKELGIRARSLDAEVARVRAEAEEHEAVRKVELGRIEPWPEPVNGAEVLNEVSGRFSLYIVLPNGAPDTMALWEMHAFAFEAFVQTPRLNLSSPEHGCGKTTALDVMAIMAPRPLRTENLTAATLFRIVDQHEPTLFLDEVDSYLNQAEELRGLLNAGHKRGACAYRCEGERKAVKSFKAFAPAVLAGIGHLPGTLHDRSIVIPMVKALPGEVRTVFDEQNVETERLLARKMARWATDNFEALKRCKPKLPETVYNRLADNWRPLFAIAEIAGGDWPERARAAFEALTANTDSCVQSAGVKLLRDIRQIFGCASVERVRSKDLLALLLALPESPWQEAHRGERPITDTWLAAQLRAFGVRPQTFRMGEQLVRGYEVADFKEAFARYLKPMHELMNGMDQ